MGSIFLAPRLTPAGLEKWRWWRNSNPRRWICSPLPSRSATPPQTDISRFLVRSETQLSKSAQFRHYQIQRTTVKPNRWRRQRSLRFYAAWPCKMNKIPGFI